MAFDGFLPLMLNAPSPSSCLFVGGQAVCTWGWGPGQHTFSPLLQDLPSPLESSNFISIEIHLAEIWASGPMWGTTACPPCVVVPRALPHSRCPHMFPPATPGADEHFSAGEGARGSEVGLASAPHQPSGG